MHKNDSCSPGIGLCKWICPSIIGFFAGIIMVYMGLMTYFSDKDLVHQVGSMALSVLGIAGHQKIAYILGIWVVVVEIFWGLSFAVGCKKTSKYAAALLAVIMFVAILAKLSIFKIPGGLLTKFSNHFQVVQFELLLFAVFLQRSLRLIKGWPEIVLNHCGTSCCMSECPCSEEKKAPAKTKKPSRKVTKK